MLLQLRGNSIAWCYAERWPSFAEKCDRLKARGPLMKAWLLPARRFLPARVETYSENGELLVESSDIEYQQVDGVLYPMRAVSRDMSKAGATIRERALQVKSVTFRASEIPDSLFHLDIPPTSAVFDLDNKTWIRDPSRINDLVDPP